MPYQGTHDPPLRCQGRDRWPSDLVTVELRLLSAGPSAIVTHPKSCFVRHQLSHRSRPPVFHGPPVGSAPRREPGRDAWRVGMAELIAGPSGGERVLGVASGSCWRD